MARGGSVLASRLARGGLTLFSIAVLVTGAILLARKDSSPVRSERVQPHRQDEDLAAYGRRIKAPAGALATARAFIGAAVLREDLPRAWQLSAPTLKAGSTRAQWLTGTIPVVPYPAKAFGSASFKVVRARERDLLLLVQIEPRPGTNGAGQDFFLELVPAGHRWLVSYWAPRGHTGPLPAAP